MPQIESNEERARAEVAERALARISELEEGIRQEVERLREEIATLRAEAHQLEADGFHPPSKIISPDAGLSLGKQVRAAILSEQLDRLSDLLGEEK